MRRWINLIAVTAPVTAIGDEPDMVERILTDGSIRFLVQLRYGYRLHPAEESDIVIASVDAILAHTDV